MSRDERFIKYLIPIKKRKEKGRNKCLFLIVLQSFYFRFHDLCGITVHTTQGSYGGDEE